MYSIYLRSLSCFLPQGHTGVVCSLCRCKVNNREVLLSGSWDTTAKIWDLDTGACLYTLSGHTYAGQRELEILLLLLNIFLSIFFLQLLDFSFLRLGITCSVQTIV